MKLKGRESVFLHGEGGHDNFFREEAVRGVVGEHRFNNERAVRRGAKDTVQ